MTDTNPEARATVAARLAREHTEAGHQWCYELAVSEYCMGLSVHEAELFSSGMDLYDAVAAAIDGNDD
jgi:hypothetical protein